MLLEDRTWDRKVQEQPPPPTETVSLSLLWDFMASWGGFSLSSIFILHFADWLFLIGWECMGVACSLDQSRPSSFQILVPRRTNGMSQFGLRVQLWPKQRRSLESLNTNIIRQGVENYIVLRNKGHHGLGRSSREERHLLQSWASPPPK